MDFTHLVTIKKNLLKEIKNDVTINKMEKLNLINKHDLLEYAPWLVHPFRKYENELIEEAKVNNPSPYGVYIADCFITKSDGCYFERHQDISYHQLAEMMEEYAEEHDGKVAIASLRSSGGSGLQKLIPLEEAINCLYDFAMETGKAGFCFDW